MATAYWIAAAMVSGAPMAAHAQTSVQQDFEAATQLTDAKNWAAALPAWEAIERRVANNPRSLSLVRLRKASVLLALDRRDEAATAAQAGLATIPVDDPSLREDRFEGHSVLAKVANEALDYATAFEQYRAARALAVTPMQRIATWWGAIETGTFVDPQATLAIDGEFDAVTDGVSIDRAVLGQLQTTRAQLYLNLGDNARSFAMAKDSVKALGGLTSQTDLNDAAARSTAALAALRLDRRNEARQYLAYTGAGRSTTGSFNAPAQMQPPACGGDSGLDPNDVAIIEFSVNDDGSVLYARPVWSSRPGDAALAFARAARDWSWTPTQFAALPSFFRNRVRVEMRCSTEFARPSLTAYATTALNAWMEGHGAAPIVLDGSLARGAAGLRTKLAAIDAAGEGASIAAVPILHALATNPATARAESHAWAGRVVAILRDNGAPPLARLAADQTLWFTADADRDYSRGYRRNLDGALRQADYAADPETRGLIALLIADSMRDGDRSDARSYIDRVANDAALEPNHPLRVGALIRVASLDYRDGQVEAARAAFERTGLSAEQCALLDATPTMTNSGFTSSRFPQEALFWQTEGWTKLEYDITAEGAPKSARVVMAYPPFVFSDASTEMLNKSRFEATFRPGNTLGCGGTSTRIMFQLPS